MRYVFPLAPCAGGCMDEDTGRRCVEAVQRACIISEYDRDAVTIMLCGGKSRRVANMSLSVKMLEYIEKYANEHALDMSGIKILCNENDQIVDLPDQIVCAQRILTPYDPWPRIDFVVDRRSDVQRLRDILSRFPDLHPGCICISRNSGKSRPYKVKKSSFWSLWSEPLFPHARLLNRA